MTLNVTGSIREALTFGLRHAVPFYVLGLAVSLPTYLHSFLPRATQMLDLPGWESATLLPRPWWETDLAVPSIDAVLFGIMVAIMAHRRQSDRRGEPGSVLASLAAAAPRLPTVAAVSLAVGLMEVLRASGGASVSDVLGELGVVLILLGFVLLTALHLIFFVAIPSAAVEGAGVIDSFKRSAALTAGSRGQLLGLFVILALPFLAAGAAMVVLLQDPIFSNDLLALWAWLIGAAVNVLFGALAVVVHEALVIIRDGAAADTLATAFD